MGFFCLKSLHSAFKEFYKTICYEKSIFYVTFITKLLKKIDTCIQLHKTSNEKTTQYKNFRTYKLKSPCNQCFSNPIKMHFRLSSTYTQLNIWKEIKGRRKQLRWILFMNIQEQVRFTSNCKLEG